MVDSAGEVEVDVVTRVQGRHPYIRCRIQSCDGTTRSISAIKVQQKENHTNHDWTAISTFRSACVGEDPLAPTRLGPYLPTQWSWRTKTSSRVFDDHLEHASRHAWKAFH